MIRKLIPLHSLEIYDSLHKRSGDGFEVDEEKDGQTTEAHREGVEYIKSILKEGQKIRPILVLDNEDGTYKRLDGFKRCIAHKELNIPYIEAFVCNQHEYRNAVFTPYHNGEMRAWHGGQEKEIYPSIFEGGERENFNYDDVIFLYKSPNHDGLRIEISDSIHVHYGAYGKNRLALGRKEFTELAKAISKIDG